MPIDFFTGINLKVEGQDDLEIFINEKDEIVITNNKEKTEEITLFIPKEDWFNISKYFNEEFKNHEQNG